MGFMIFNLPNNPARFSVSQSIHGMCLSYYHMTLSKWTELDFSWRLGPTPAWISSSLGANPIKPLPVMDKTNNTPVVWNYSWWLLDSVCQENFTANILVSKHKDKITLVQRYIVQRYIRFSTEFDPIILIFMNEKESFHYIIKNIIKDNKNKYNYWISKISYIFSHFIFTPRSI